MRAASTVVATVLSGDGNVHHSRMTLPWAVGVGGPQPILRENRGLGS